MNDIEIRDEGINEINQLIEKCKTPPSARDLKHGRATENEVRVLGANNMMQWIDRSAGLETLQRWRIEVSQGNRSFLGQGRISSELIVALRTSGK